MKKYTLLSNFIFAYKPVWQHKRIFIWDSLLEIVFSVVVPLFGLSLSALVIRLLGNKVSLLTLIITILCAFVCYAIANALQSFVRSKHNAHNIEIRLELFNDQITKKELSLPLEETESPEVRLLQEKAAMAISHNWGGIEGYFRYSNALGIGVLGLVVYAVLAGTIHPLIIIMLLVLSTISVLVDSLPNWYYKKVKDKLASENMTKEYIDKIVLTSI